jgi:hypothetical protein
MGGHRLWRYRLYRYRLWFCRLYDRRRRLHVLLNGRSFGLHGFTRLKFLPCRFATRFAFPPRRFLARLRFGTHLGPVHFPLPLA